ncbi:MAG: nucleotidyltransferase family protein [Candidatus Scalinduaceae bacterium]
MVKKDMENLKPEIGKLAKKHNLSLVLLYGSQARGKISKDSDIDIAVLGIRPISTEELIGLHNEFAQIFEVKEIDVKSLHSTDALFRYQVMRNAILLYGRSYDYNIFKAYAFRDYHDSKDLLRLKETLTKKRVQSFKI